MGVGAWETGSKRVYLPESVSGVSYGGKLTAGELCLIVEGRWKGFLRSIKSSKERE